MSTSINPNQKLFSAYQVVLNGLQAYLSHLPSSIGGCSSDKLKLLLKQLIELLDVHNRMVKDSEEGNYGHLITVRKKTLHFMFHNLFIQQRVLEFQTEYGANA